ncbi:phosphatidylethanolamine N-methyltransferase /phosphatidyl-N-methylethanolamine N-methyltransferase [Propionicimonas paludicola]|uniref:Phosphatidylethanolamine N-methyltransferase /phosphatidyl-N-methylethanolamine N-methyltransferase n=1 Tax=Propionicimonas paludicola TaxID=185243 RepID=A0A2A9CUF1_9ACTN|nr:class I SAM-dependent methyltransferase [Propionicimonas paludicola]PFG18018.1 phosphatidylethanolamine N-methyltransferase /phosphatidyl-N-methylethanolamine N-methyltransferase [Propionicimonas paludicola]
MEPTAKIARFDTLMTRLERRYFPHTRRWICSRASGRTLEVAVGTGLNLSHYPPGLDLHGVDREPDALALAAQRSDERKLGMILKTGDAGRLPYPDASFDTVVCTFALCEVPKVEPVLREFARVLRPDGQLLLADHVIATDGWVRLAQRLLEAVTIPLGGEHYTRRPSQQLPVAGFAVVESERLARGAIEQLRARLVSAEA